MIIEKDLYKFINTMSKVSKLVQINSSITENIAQSPEEQLKYISSHNSFEPSSPKILPHSFRKRQQFTLNGWSNNQNRIITSKTAKSRHTSVGKYDMNGTICSSRGKDTQKETFRSLEVKLNQKIMHTNFKYHITKSKPKIKIPSNYSEFQQFKQHLKRQKQELIDFYKNQKAKRTLMNDLLDLQKSVKIVQYPLMIANSSPTKKNKLAVYRRHFA